jgi:hypothetical protein
MRMSRQQEIPSSLLDFGFRVGIMRKHDGRDG